MSERYTRTRSHLRFSSMSLVVFSCLWVMFSFILVSASIAETYNYSEVLPPGWTKAYAFYSINNSGQVVGYGSDGTTMKGFMLSITDGKYAEILPPGLTGSYAIAINNSGQVVGFGSDGKGFVYNSSDGSYTGILPPGCTSAYAMAVNNSGQVVGSGSMGKGSCSALPIESIPRYCRRVGLMPTLTPSITAARWLGMVLTERL